MRPNRAISTTLGNPALETTLKSRCFITKCSNFFLVVSVDGDWLLANSLTRHFTRRANNFAHRELRAAPDADVHPAHADHLPPCERRLQRQLRLDGDLRQRLDHVERQDQDPARVPRLQPASARGNTEFLVGAGQEFQAEAAKRRGW